jgi:hypothetical protein
MSDVQVLTTRLHFNGNLSPPQIINPTRPAKRKRHPILKRTTPQRVIYAKNTKKINQKSLRL